MTPCPRLTLTKVQPESPFNRPANKVISRNLTTSLTIIHSFFHFFAFYFMFYILAENKHDRLIDNIAIATKFIGLPESIKKFVFIISRLNVAVLAYFEKHY